MRIIVSKWPSKQPLVSQIRLVSCFCMWRSDLDEIAEAQVDAAGFLWDFHVADGDVGHDGQHERLESLVETVGEALGPRHLKRWPGPKCKCRSLALKGIKMSNGQKYYENR